MVQFGGTGQMGHWIRKRPKPEAEEQLAGHLVPGHQSPGLPLDHLQVVVQEAEEAHPEEGHQGHDRVPVGQIRPEKGGEARRP